MADQANEPQEDVLSYCGSLSGETFTARRRRRSSGTLKVHSIHKLAKQLKEYQFDVEGQNSEQIVFENSSSRLNTSFHSFRLIIICLGGIALGCMYLTRYGISVAILSMVNQTALYMAEHPNRTIEDFLAEGYSTGGEFEWDNEIQQMIMSWYMIAYTLPQLPCTKLGLMLGCRLAIPILLTLCAVSNLLTPMAAYYGWEYVLGLRLINGVGGAAVLPLMLSLIENWMHPEEISLGITSIQLIQACLVAANSLFSGYLCNLHWSYAFYVPGAFVILFSLVWLLLVTDRPEESKLISEQELAKIAYGRTQPIERTRAATTTTTISAHNGDHLSEDGRQSKVDCCQKQLQSETIQETSTLDCEPKWYHILLKPSFYAYIIISCCYNSTFNVFLFTLPTYLRQFLKIGVSLNGFYCSVILSGTLIAVIWPHFMLRYLHINLRLPELTSLRLTHLGLCLMLIATWIYVALFHQFQLIIFFINRCFHTSHEIVITICLMRNYAKSGMSGIALSMINTFGCLSIVFASTLAGYYLDYTGQSVEGWSSIFFVLGLTQVLVFGLFFTMIRAEPMEFGSQPKKVEKPKPFS